jgi:imidazolonepropionase-like amidohydrolase
MPPPSSSATDVGCAAVRQLLDATHPVPGCGARRRNESGPACRVSLLVDNHRIGWIRPVDDAPDYGPDVEVVDASGCTVVPGLVDSHSYLSLRR